MRRIQNVALGAPAPGLSIHCIQDFIADSFVRVVSCLPGRSSCRAWSSASDTAAWTAAVRRRPPTNLTKL